MILAHIELQEKKLYLLKRIVILIAGVENSFDSLSYHQSESKRRQLRT